MADRSIESRAPARSFLTPVTAWQRWGIVLISLTIAAGAFLAAPPSLLGKCDLVGYALCHRMPAHSLHLSGRQLPLCARCSGTYLGALWGLLFMGTARRRRPSQLPPAPILALLFGFFLLYGVDGLNSYVSLFPGLPYLYEPHNLLRFATGALNGLTVSALVLPLFNSTFWHAPDLTPSIQGWRDMLALLAGAGGLMALAAAGFPVLLYPLAVGSVLSVMSVLTLVNTTLPLMALGQEGQVKGWAEAWPLLVGMDLALLEISALVLMRGLITNWLDIPL